MPNSIPLVNLVEFTPIEAAPTGLTVADKEGSLIRVCSQVTTGSLGHQRRSENPLQSAEL